MGFKEKFSSFFMFDEEDYEVKESSSPSLVAGANQAKESHTSYNNQNKSGGLSLVSSRQQTGNKTRIRVVQPRMYSEVKEIADIVLSKQSVILNFKRMENDQAKKVIDFLMGTVYAIDGDLQRIGDSIFLCTPNGIEIDMDDLGTFETTEHYK